MIKKSGFKNVKKKIVGAFMALGLTVSAFGGLTLATNTHASAYYQQSSSYFSDANFTSYSGSSPYTPTQWKVVEGEGNYNSDTMMGAIFNSKSTTTSYIKKYKVFSNPGLPTSKTIENNSNLYYSLALSAPYSSGGRFGFQPKTSKLTLNKDSFYAIEVTLKTISLADTSDTDGYDSTYASSVDSMASIYINGFSNSEKDRQAKFEMIQSKFGKDVYNGWGTYVFYIATNQLYDEENLDLQLWLGSKTQVSSGSVFFNNIKVYEMDQNTFDRSSTGNKYSKLVDLRSFVNQSPITNANFDSTWTNGWAPVSALDNNSTVANVNISTFGGSLVYNKHNLTANDNPAKTNDRDFLNNVLFMANNEETYTAIESIDEFTFNRQSYYKVSVWGWSNSGATASVALTNTTDDIDIKDASISVNTSSKVGENSTNGWTEYSFYVYGDEFVDTTAKLRLQLGTSEKGSTGYAFFDNITIQEITYEEFSNNSSNSNSTIFNYNSDSTDGEDSISKVANYSFDITENKDTTNNYPLAPASWTYTESATGENVTNSGVINTHEDLFNSSAIAVNGGSNPSRPSNLPYLATDSYNNVLMLGSRFKSTQTYTSKTFTLDANSYTKISAFIMADRGGAKIKVSNSNGVIFEKSNITSLGWTEFNSYIRTGSSEENVTIELSLINNTNTTKYAFFDEIIVETSSENVFNATTPTVNNSNIYSGKFNTKVDLVNYTFDNDSVNSINGWDVAEANDNKFAKVMNTLEEYGVDSHSGNNALVVYSNDFIDGVNYLATNKRTYTLSNNSYYKISVFAKTKDISNGGATIKLSGTGLDKSFVDINTEQQNTNNWTEYTFFIKTNAETTATLALGLGNETTLSSGLAMFDDITFTKLADEKEYNTLTSSLNSDTQQAVVVETTDDTTVEEDKDEEKPFEGSFNWYIVTSLITALSIIIAVVGVSLRKVNFKKLGKAKIKSQYDRRRTLDVSLDKKERIAKRQEEIKELEKQLKEIEDEIAGITHEVETEREAFEKQHSNAKAVIEERKKSITEEKEKALHDRNEKIAKDKNAFTREEEEKFAQYIKKLEKQEQKESQEIAKHDKAINNFKSSHSLRLQKSIARQEFIKAEIARIDAEIEAIAKEEAQIWEDYRLAKADAKRRKAEYKAEIKAEKANKKASKEQYSENKPEETTTEVVENSEVKESHEQSTNAETKQEVEEVKNTEVIENTEEVEVITPDEEQK